MWNAAVNGDNETLESLVDDDGGNIHFQAGEYGTSLLHEAASRGNIRGVEFLLVKGIHAGVKDINGTTPLHRCVTDRFTNDRAKIVTTLCIMAPTWRRNPVSAIHHSI
jgi:ankyrin repeat protein